MTTPKQELILAITGASGAIYAVRLLQVLLAAGRDVHLSISESGKAVLREELGVEVDLNRFQLQQLTTVSKDADANSDLLASVLNLQPGGKAPFPTGPSAGRVHYHHYLDLMAPLASGSFQAGGMAICPCSGTTLSAIAHSGAGNLIHRAAEVQLKERRPLVIVPRETPVSVTQLENMQRAARAGAVVLPAAPGWYHGVRRIGDLVDFVVARVCDQLGVEHDLMRRWGS